MGQTRIIGIEQLTSAMNGFGTHTNQLINAMTAFGTYAQSLTQALQAFPAKLEITGRQTHEVIFNGAEVFSHLEGDIAQLVENKAKSLLNQVFKDKMPEAGVSIE